MYSSEMIKKVIYKLQVLYYTKKDYVIGQKSTILLLTVWTAANKLVVVSQYF